MAGRESKDEGGRMKDEVEAVIASPSSLIPPPSSFRKLALPKDSEPSMNTRTKLKTHATALCLFAVCALACASGAAAAQSKNKEKADAQAAASGTPSEVVRA